MGRISNLWVLAGLVLLAVSFCGKFDKPNLYFDWSSEKENCRRHDREKEEKMCVTLKNGRVAKLLQATSSGMLKMSD